MADKYVKNISLTIPMAMDKKLHYIVANTKVGNRPPTIRSIILLAIEEAIQKFEDAGVLDTSITDIHIADTGVTNKE